MTQVRRTSRKLTARSVFSMYFHSHPIMYKLFIAGPYDCIPTRVATQNYSRRSHMRELLFGILVSTATLIS